MHFTETKILQEFENVKFKSRSGTEGYNSAVSLKSI